MTQDLRALEDWAGALLNRLEPAARRKLSVQLGRELRRRQQQRITAQRNADGTPYAPRKPRQLRGKTGHIKRKMFAKLRTARYLRVQATANGIAMGFSGRISRIARIHQYGLRDRPGRGAPDVRYAQRDVLGFAPDDLEWLRDRLLEHLTAD